MKKTLVIASAILMTVSGAQAQFLNRIIDRATSKITGTSSTNSRDGVDEIFLNPNYGQAEPASREVYTYEGRVTPVAANDVMGLLDKLPAIPAGSELLHPTKAVATAFSRDLQAVAARAEQLANEAGEASMNEMMAQQQAQMSQRQQRNESNQEVMNFMNGMSDQDMQRFMSLGQKLDEMSDKEAEIYLNSHPDDKQFLQSFGEKVALLGDRQPATVHQPVMPQTRVVEDKASSIISSALSLNDFNESDAAKIQANSQEEYQLKLANAWHNYLAGIVAKVKKEIKVLADDSSIPSMTKLSLYSDVNSLCEYLANAYDGQFGDYVPENFEKDVIRQLKLEPEEYIIRPENFLATFDAQQLYKRNNETGNLFRFNNGKWTRLPDDYQVDIEQNLEPQPNRIIKSADGKRQVVISGTVGFIRLPEGNVIYPTSVSVSGNTIRWTDLVNIEGTNPTDQVTWQIVECTYVL